MRIIEIAMLAVMVVGPVALGIFLSLLLTECEEEARRHGERRAPTTLRKPSGMTLAKRVLGLLMLACATGAHVRLDMVRRRAGLR